MCIVGLGYFQADHNHNLLPDADELSGRRLALHQQCREEGQEAGYAEVRPRLGVESRALFDQLHLFRPSSKVVIRFLTVMMKHGYISEFEVCCNLMHDLSSKSLAFIRSSMIIALAKLWST